MASATSELTRPTSGTGVPGNASGGGGSSSDRITVSLASRTSAALEAVVAATGDNKTDSINKAICFYAELRRLVEAGGALYLKEPGASEAERVRFF
jgi:hypothetical protein